MQTNGQEQEPVFDIPVECKAGVVVNEGPNFTTRVEMVPVPQPGPNDVLIKLNCTGLCYSDIHHMSSDITGMPPMSSFGVRSPGHEGAGVIVKKGSEVKHLRVGQRAGLKPIYDTCGACDLCWSDKECHCPKAEYTGLARTGSYQQYVLSPAKYTTPIPDGVPDEVAGPVMCSAATIYNAIHSSGLVAGDWACFPGGGGGVGIQGVQLAKAMGMQTVVVDTGDNKRELSKRMGADAFIDFQKVDDVAAAVKEACGGVGAHGVFVTAAQAYSTAVSLTGTRVGAKIVCIGIRESTLTTCTIQLGMLILDPTIASGTGTFIGGDPSMFILRNLTVTGSLVASMRDVSIALDYAKRGALRPICEIIPIDKLPEGVERLRRGEVAGRLVVDFNA